MLRATYSDLSIFFFSYKDFEGEQRPITNAWQKWFVMCMAPPHVGPVPPARYYYWYANQIPECSCVHHHRSQVRHCAYPANRS